MREQVIFDSVFPLVGALNKGISIGEVGQSHTEECQEMITEIARVKLRDRAFVMSYDVHL